MPILDRFYAVGLTMVASAGVAQIAAQKVPLTPRDAIAAWQVETPNCSPDGARVAVTVMEPPRAATQSSHIWNYSVRSGRLQQFTNSSKSETRPSWSPDGEVLAFLSDRAGFEQIYLIRTDGGEALQLTADDRSIEQFVWSPDGRQIAFLAPEAKTEADKRREENKDDASSVDHDAKRSHLWLVDIDSHQARRLVGRPWHFSELQWSPRGNQLVVIATNHPESDQYTNRIFRVNSVDGTMQEIAAPRGPFENLRVSPDGSQISYVGSRIDGPSAHDLYLQPLGGGTARNVTATRVDRSVKAYRWRAATELVVLIGDGFHSKLLGIDTEGRARTLWAPRLTVSDFCMSPSGSGVLVAGNFTQPPELWSWNGRSAPALLSAFNAAFKRFALVPPAFVHYQSYDGRQIEAAVLKPTQTGGTAREPAVVLVHGGPTAKWSDSFDTFSSWGQLLAGAGYIVLYPNIRGSTGYGYDFMVSNRGDWGGGDFKDVMAGVDYLISSGNADPKRLGIAGWSYGGYMAAWAVTQTDRFKAAVAGAGMSDLATEYGTEIDPAYDEWFFGLPYERPERFAASSPIAHIRNARTPTLILHGAADSTDPISQSQMLYRGLKRYGVETDLIVYPREEHVFKEEQHQVDVLERMVRWFDQHLK